MSPRLNIYLPFLASYIETAVWSSTDMDGTPLNDSKYSDTEFSNSAIQAMTKDCLEFIERSAGILDANTNEYPVAHDFWLTRNGHGAGFWDGDYPEPISSQLTKLSEEFGECNLYIGDDGKFYVA